MTDDKLRENIRLWYEPVEMPGGYTFSYPDTLIKINAYYNSRFLSGDYDDQGQKKIFYNIVKPSCDVATKFIDLDTKNIIFIPENNNDEYSLMLMQKKFKRWLKDNEFSVFLNECGQKLPKYGHIVVKKTKEGWKNVNLMNLRLDPSVSKLEDSPFVYEINTMTRDEILEMNWNGDDLDYIKEEKDNKQFIVYECYHKVGKNKWERTIKTGLFNLKKDNGVIETPESMYVGKDTDKWLPSLTLHKDNNKLPYRECKFEEVEGRHLGLGFVEMLFDPQIRINEIQYLKAKALYLKALQVFYSRDENIGDNLITDVDFGDIKHTTSEIVQVQRDNVDLSAYNQEENRWDMAVTNLTHKTDIAMGDRLPSQTPLGLGELQAGLTISFFNLKRENFALFIKKIIFDDILPEFKKKNKESHTILIPKTEDEYEILLQETIESTLTDVVNKVVQSGYIPSYNELKDIKNKIEQKLRSKNNLEFKINKGFYDNLKANIDIIITGESLDISSKQSIYQFVLSTMATNPQILISPITRTIFFKIIELMGQNPLELGLLKQLSAQFSQQNTAPIEGSKVAPAPQTPQQTLSVNNLEV